MKDSVLISIVLEAMAYWPRSLAIELRQFQCDIRGEMMKIV